MSEEPASLPREELLEQISGARAVLIEAPSGFGKTTLLRQVVARLGIATVWVTLEGPTDVSTLTAHLAAAARQAGLSAVADAFVNVAGRDDGTTWPPFAAGEWIEPALGRWGQPLLVVVDEAQRLEVAAGRWLGVLARHLADDSTVAVAGRRLPAAVRNMATQGAERLTGSVIVDERGLRFGRDDVAALAALRAAHRGVAPHGGPDVEELTVDLIAATDGWPAAVGLALAVREREGSVASSEPVVGLGADETGLIDLLVHRLLAAVDPVTAGRIVRLAAVPLLDDAVAETVAGEGALTALLDAGVPVTRRPDGWLVLPDPVREVLEPLAVLGVEDRRAAARALASRRQLGAAVALLHGAGDIGGAVDLLAECPVDRLAAIGLGRLRTVLSVLGADAVCCRPELLVAAARVAEFTDAAQRLAWLEAAVAAAEQLDRYQVVRAATAELAREAVRHGDLERAQTLAQSVLTSSDPAEVTTRGRALAALGHLATVRASPTDLVEAESYLEEATTLFRLAGEREWESDALLRLGYAVSYHGGRFDRAVEQLTDALALLPAADRARGNALTYLAEVLRAVGRLQEADAAAREALTIGQRIGDSWVIAAACWVAMGNAGATGDLDGIRRWIGGVERSPGPWLETGAGFEFNLEAGDLLAANGDVDAARQFHERAVTRADAADGTGLHHALAQLTFRLEAMYGDPLRAATLFDEIDDGPWAVQRNRWVRRMIRALAEQRAGDIEAAARFVEEGWRELELLGDPSLFARTEPRMYHTLAPLLPLGRATVAPTTTSSAGPRVTVLGGFAVRSGGAGVTPAAGYSSTLVKLLAVRGPVPVEEVIDLLWSNVDVAAGRARLRNLLNRLRERSGPLVERRGELLGLSADVSVDAVRFETAAGAVSNAALAERVGLARTAISLYTGELLPGDRHLDWLAAPRERLRRRYLGLVDLVAESALDANDLDEALGLLDVGLAAEPYDEVRYVKSVRALLGQGRRNAAAEVLRRGLSAVTDLGVDPGRDLASLAGQLGVQW